MINLFSHNLSAYESAAEMLQETGKVAIIHPTGTGKFFIAFKLCENNEGIHVDDVDGVVLFRPTVSPIIYKQQIGRALSASKGKLSVIFDIANNVYNLYSVGVLEEELLQEIGRAHV